MIAQTIVLKLSEGEGLKSHANVIFPNNIKMMSTSTYKDADGNQMLAITLLIES